MLWLVTSTTSQEQNDIEEKSATCDGGFVYFCILFREPFSGLIYSDGYYGVHRCNYVVGNGSVHYNFTVALNDCGTERLVNGSVRHALVVQRDPRILGGYDNLFVVVCSPVVAAQLDVQPGQPFTVRFGGVTVDGQLRSSEVVAEAVASSLEYATDVLLGHAPTGQPVNRPLNIGEPITYVIKIRSTRMKYMRVGRCWASDDTSQLKLSDDRGCSLRKGESIWNEFGTITSMNNDTVFYNTIKAWAFPTSNRVNIFCNVHFCQGPCPPQSCQTESDKQLNEQQTLSMKRPKKRSDRVISDLRATYSVIVPRLGSNCSDLVNSSGECVVCNSATTPFVQFITAAAPKAAQVSSARAQFCLSYSNFVLVLSMTSSLLLLCCVFVAYMSIKYFKQCHCFIK